MIRYTSISRFVEDAADGWIIGWKDTVDFTQSTSGSPACARASAWPNGRAAHARATGVTACLAGSGRHARTPSVPAYDST